MCVSREKRYRMVEIHRISGGNVNCYIVAHNGRAILIDTGRKQHREKILKMCKEHQVSLIVLTHGHMDHCQNAAYLKEALQIPIAISPKDMDLIPDNRKQPLFAQTFLGKVVRAISLSSFEKDSLVPFAPDIFLKEGDNLRAYGIDAKIIELPGHTNGSIGIKTGNNLFVGDALMNMFYPTVSMLYTDEKVMRQSAARISRMGKLKIHFGHGKSLANRVWVKEEFKEIMGRTLNS